jgi:MFS transporter, DHA1 family, multidrug resistance protein
LNVTSAAVTSAITVFLAVFGLGQLLVGPLSDRYGRRWPVLIGFAVFFAGSVWCGLATDLPYLLIGRVVQATGACATAVLSRAIARDMFSGAALARAMAAIMIVMTAAAGFSPLLGGALDHSLGWRAEFALVAAFSAVSAVAYGIFLGETHNSIRTPLNPVAAPPSPTRGARNGCGGAPEGAVAVSERHSRDRRGLRSDISVRSAFWIRPD